MKRDTNAHALATYVSDMLALERHVRVPFETQSKDTDFEEYGADELVQALFSTANQHIELLEPALERLGGHPGSPVKSAVTQLEGFFAGAIDKVRKTKVSKALRDDFTALALCNAGYTALLSTANALGDNEVATLAEAMLQDYAGLIMEIGEALPAVVVAELDEATDLDVDVDSVEDSRERVTAAWRGQETDSEGVETTVGIVESTGSILR